METFARYEHQPNFTRNLDLAVLSALLGNTFVGTLSMDNLPSLSNMMQNGLSAGGFAGTGTDATRPYAYLNYMLFNESLQFVDGGAWRVSTAAAFYPGEEGDPTRVHEKLTFPGPVTVSQKGFVYVWVSNESKNAKVWFDDLKVTHVQGIVTQATDYYPYGSVARELKTPEDAVYRFGYQGQFAEKDDETGWSHFELREFDPIVGRWTVNDPFGQYYSPYLGIGNDPVNNFDEDGGFTCESCPKSKEYDRYRQSSLNFDYSDQVSGDGAFLLLSGTTVSAGFGGYNSNLYNSFGANLLDNNFYARLHNSAPSRDAQTALLKARLANKDGTPLYATLAIPVVAIAAATGIGELISAAPAIGSASGQLYWKALGGANYTNLLANKLLKDGAFKIAYATAPILGRTEIGRNLAIRLAIYSHRGYINFFKVGDYIINKAGKGSAELFD